CVKSFSIPKQLGLSQATAIAPAAFAKQKSPLNKRCDDARNSLRHRNDWVRAKRRPSYRRDRLCRADGSFPHRPHLAVLSESRTRRADRVAAGAWPVGGVSSRQG